LKDFLMSNPQTNSPTPVLDHAARIDGTTLPSAVSHDEVARRAHEIYLKTGSIGGQCSNNWNQAERELKDEALVMCAAHACCGPTAAGLAGVIGQHAPLPVSLPAGDAATAPVAGKPGTTLPKAAGAKG
jgi:hypothetical protein